MHESAAGLEEQHRKKRATWLWRKAVADFVNILLRKKVCIEECRTTASESEHIEGTRSSKQILPLGAIRVCASRRNNGHDTLKAETDSLNVSWLSIIFAV